MAYLYTVHVDIADAAIASEYLGWLTTEGHLAHVVAAGASSATVVQLDGAGPGVSFQVLYWFDDAAAFQRYEAGPAVALRAEGQARFPASRGLTLRRTRGATVGSHPA